MERRDFLKASAVGAAGIMMPGGVIRAANLASPAARTKKSANGKINMGFIGLGQQAMYLLSGFMSMDDVRVVAGCDVYDIKRDRFVKRGTVSSRELQSTIRIKVKRKSRLMSMRTIRTFSPVPTSMQS